MGTCCFWHILVSGQTLVRSEQKAIILVTKVT
jgi:hypothetical protein